MQKRRRSSGTLSRQSVRADLETQIPKLGRFYILFALVVVPLVLAGAFMVSTGSKMGFVFLLGPAAITGLACYLLRRDRTRKTEQLNSFDRGEFSLREMTLTGKRSRESRDSDGNSSTSYYLDLRQEDGTYSCTQSVDREEYREAAAGDRFYVLLVRGEPVMQYNRKSFSPDEEMQAMLDGRPSAAKTEEPERAASLEPAPGTPIPIDLEQQKGELERAGAGLRRAIALNRGLLGFLLLYVIFAFLLLQKGGALYRRVSMLSDVGKGLLVMALFALLWGVYYAVGSLRRKNLRGQRLPKAVFEGQLEQLSREGKIAGILITLIHVVLLFSIGSLFR